MWLLRALSVVAASVAVLVASIRPAEAGAIFASEVVSYNPGATAVSGYTSSSAALGSPNGLTGQGTGYPGVVSVFNPPWDTNQIVSIGEGGQLTLKLPQYAYVKPGLSEIGVFTNAGLMDANYPNGVCTNPAVLFGNYGSAKVEVSQDGAQWVSLGARDFNTPTNYYLNATPYDTAAPTNPQVADFGTPFDSGLSSFTGKTYSQILTLLDGSAGGTWLDLSTSGLSRIQYLRFSVLDDGDAMNDSQLEIDAVSIANGALTVPEPATSALVGLGGLFGLALRRCRRII